MQVLMSMDEHAMSAPVGGTNEDGDSGISRGTLGYATEHEYYATAELQGAAHGDGDNEPNGGAYQSAAEPIDQNTSQLIPIVTDLG
jgi:hypothetical protein